jgi:hypothetical protein
MNNRISSPVIQADLLLSRRYHQNINRFQSPCKRSEKKELTRINQIITLSKSGWEEFVRQILYATPLHLTRIYSYEVQKEYDFRYHYSSCSLSLLKVEQF